MAARIQLPIEAITSRFNISSRFDGMRSQSLTSRFSNLKPISEFVDIKRLSKPANFSEAQNRVNYNLSYFSSNYMVVFVMLSIYTLLTNLLLFFDILLIIGGMWGIGKLQGRDLNLGFVRATVSQLYTALICISVPLGFIANPFSAGLWLIGASGVCILGHAAFMDKPIESAFSEEAPGRSQERLTNYDAAQLRKRRNFWDIGKRGIRSEDDAVKLASIDPGYLIQAAGDYANFVSDQLQFTGFDLGSARRPESEYLQDDVSSVAEYEDSWEVERRRYSTHLRALKEKDKALVRSANEKIRRAKEKGKSKASLTADEIEAMERRRLQERQDDDQKKHRRASSGKNSRNNSTSDLHVEKARRKSGNRVSSSPAANTPVSRSRKPKSPKTSRTTSLDTTMALPSAGHTLLGPDERPAYSPATYMGQPAYRSTSDAHGGELAAAYEASYIPYSQRYFTPQEYRPSPSSRHSAADELHIPPSRARAASSVQHDEWARSQAAALGRRNVSGPVESAYSRLRPMDMGSPLPELLSRPPTPPHAGHHAELEPRAGFYKHDDSNDSMGSVVVVNEEGSTSELGGHDGVQVGSKDQRAPRIDRVPVGGRSKDKQRRRKR